jgi:hypothetical protein
VGTKRLRDGKPVTLDCALHTEAIAGDPLGRDRQLIP